MKFKGDVGLYLSGSQVAVPECGIFITPPTIKQISQIGEDKFFQAIQLLSHADDVVAPLKEGNLELSRMDSFQILMIVLREQEELGEIITSFFGLVCPEFNIVFGKNSIDFKTLDSDMVKGKIHQYNSEEFSTTITEMFLPKDFKDTDFNPANEAAKKIAEKLKKARDRKKDTQRKDDSQTSIFALYASTLAVGMSMDLNVIYNYTPFQMYDIYNRYWLKTQYDMYQKIATTPMMDVSKMQEPEHWSKNLYGINAEDGAASGNETNNSGTYVF